MGFDYLECLTESLIDHDKKEAEYRHALETVLKMSNQGFWIWNIETSYLFLTWPWLDGLGYKEGNFAPHIDTWISLCHPDDYKKAEKMLTEHFNSHGLKPYDLIIRYKSARNAWVPLRSYGKVCSWDGNKPIIMVGLVEP